jgi:hypothetical protein
MTNLLTSNLIPLKLFRRKEPKRKLLTNFNKNLTSGGIINKIKKRLPNWDSL